MDTLLLRARNTLALLALLKRNTLIAQCENGNSRALITPDPFCSCGRRRSECDRSRAGCQGTTFWGLS